MYHLLTETCNAGFIVDGEQRGLGIGKCMGQAFLQLAPLCGYKQAMFNLVFVSNEASVRLWRTLGFKEIGRLPNAGRLKDEQLHDAIMFYHQFT
jgi:L-amino acid N-acyltransferase YncA